MAVWKVVVVVVETVLALLFWPKDVRRRAYPIIVSAFDEDEVRGALHHRYADLLPSTATSGAAAEFGAHIGATRPY